MRKPMSLWSVMAVITALATISSLVVAGALVYLAAILHRTTLLAVDAAESVRIADAARTDLLRYPRDPLRRRQADARLVRELTEARRYVSSPEEGRILEEAESLVKACTDSAERSLPDLAARQEDASRALDALVAINIDQSEEAQKQAGGLDALGTTLGLGMGALLVVEAAGLLFWMRRTTIDPVLVLAETMERFGTGDREARAQERGPAEILQMARCFNFMADAIGAEHRARVAFLGGVAHDLRNPLAAMRHTMDLLERDGAAPPDRRRQMLERLDRQVGRMERMVEDFLDMTRVEAGELRLTCRPHDVRRIIEQAVQGCEGALTQHRLTVLLPGEPLEVRCDPLRIEQVMSNLLSNAVKYSPAGSAVEVTARREDGRALMEVIDQGIGLTEEERRQIFEPFRRVGSSRDTTPGLGLGLYVARRIVEAHGGDIQVRSRPRHGSAFCVSLPLLGREKSGLPPAERPPLTQRGGAGAGS